MVGESGIKLDCHGSAAHDMDQLSRRTQGSRSLFDMEERISGDSGFVRGLGLGCAPSSVRGRCTRGGRKLAPSATRTQHTGRAPYRANFNFAPYS